jgi:nicotinate-nucleotide adenylyltransferase
VNEERLRQRVGVYGGTFDPVHNGHLMVANAILQTFALDRMLFIPAFVPPHKRKQTISSPFHRLAMLALATADAPQIFVSAIELESPSRPYTIETLRRLQTELDPVQLFFVMGADSFRDVNSWREYERILGDYDVIVAMRPRYYNEGGFGNKEKIADNLAPQLQVRIMDLCGGQSPSKENLQSPHIYLTDYVMVDVSATDIREAARQGRAIDNVVPPAVASYIAKYKLYQ